MTADPLVDLRRRFTVEEYERMGEVGVFGPDERTELLDGEIVAMSPIGPRHANVVDAVTEAFFRRLLGRARIRVQNPVRLPPRSEPQPDVVVAHRRSGGYRNAHPTAAETFLVVEVAESSLATDRAIKVPIYARQGIPEVWIIDIAGDVVHVHSDPVDGVYRAVRKAVRGESISPVALPDVSFEVDDLLGE